MLTRHPAALYLRPAMVLSAALLLLAGCSFPKIIVLHDPLSVEEHDSLGRVYESQGKTDLADQQYRAALKIDPKSLPSLLLLGDLSYRTGNYAEAASIYSALIKLQPDNGDVYNNLAQVYLEQNTEIDKAGDLVTKALAVNPEHRAYYLDTLGIIRLRQGRIAEAVAALQESAALLPQDNASNLAEAYAHLSEAYRAAGDAARADDAGRTAASYRARK